MGATTCLSASCPNSSGLPYLWKTGTTSLNGCLGAGCNGHYTEATGNNELIYNAGNPNQATFFATRFENAALNITSIAVAAGVATITWSGTGPTFLAGQSVLITGTSVSACNNTFSLLSATTFTAGGCTNATGGGATVTTVIPNSAGEHTVTSPWDQHPSWNNQGNSDTLDFVTSTFCNNPCATPYTHPLTNEIYRKNSVTGAIARFANTYSADNSQTFEVDQAIGQVSQDGRFFMWSSDWMGDAGQHFGGRDLHCRHRLPRRRLCGGVEVRLALKKQL